MLGRIFKYLACGSAGAKFIALVPSFLSYFFLSVKKFIASFKMYVIIKRIKRDVFTDVVVGVRIFL